MSNLCIHIYLGTWKEMEIIKRVSIYNNNILILLYTAEDRVISEKFRIHQKTRSHDNMIKIKIYTNITVIYTSSCIHIHTYINVFTI